MGYMHIDNLYKAQEIFQFKTCYALEKIHGTSAHVRWQNGRVGYHSGGESASRFEALFDEQALQAKFLELFTPDDHVVVYGEAYGGKQQGMRKTYGDTLRFAVFDVRVGESWLSVPQAAQVTTQLGLEFVQFEEISTTLESLNAARDMPSTQAVRNGISEPQLREGVVLRPPFEVMMNGGRRLIAKHKRAEFSERGQPKVELDPTRRELLANADAIALEWVTPMRLEHVVDALLQTRAHKDIEMRDTPAIVALMIEDVTREAAGEIVDNVPVRKAIAARAVQLFKQRVQTIAV